MKLKFKKQAYQTAAVDAVADCFAGQPFSGGLTSRVPRGREDASGQVLVFSAEVLECRKVAEKKMGQLQNEPIQKNRFLREERQRGSR